GVGLLLGGGQLVAQIVGLDACGLLGRLDGRQAGLQFLDLGGQAVGKLGGLGPVGFQVGAGFVQCFALGCQTGVCQLQCDAPDLGPDLCQPVAHGLRCRLA